MRNEEFEFLAKNLTKRSYRFAKTMPQNPHWYSLRKEWEGESEIFSEIVLLIRKYGYKEKFGRTWYTLFDVNGFKYWTMGAPVNETILINRTTVKLKSGYDAIADKYVGLFKDEKSIQEDEDLLFNKITVQGRVLDIGCGSGLLLDYVPDEMRYVGIDPSEKMLNHLMSNFDLSGGNKHIIKTPFERYFDEHKEGFDTIVSLYGSASYISIEALDRIQGMLKDGGFAYLMFYKDGYFPRTHKELNFEMPFMKKPHKSMKGYFSSFDFNNYTIVVIAK